MYDDKSKELDYTEIVLFDEYNHSCNFLLITFEPENLQSAGTGGRRKKKI